MTLPTSGPLSLSDIQTEFGGSNPISLNEYYAGGGLVPSGTTGTYGAVPTSGAISIQNFYGTSNAPPLSVSASNVSNTELGFADPGNVSSAGESPGTTPSGGTAPYTYAWTHIGTTGGDTPNISSATAQNPYWYATVYSGDPSTSTWQVTVTDSNSNTASDTITVTLTWIDIR